MAYAASWGDQSAYAQTTDDRASNQYSQYDSGAYSQYDSGASYQTANYNSVGAEVPYQQQYPTASYNDATNTHYSQNETYQQLPTKSAKQKNWWASTSNPIADAHPNTDDTSAAVVTSAESEVSSPENDFNVAGDWQEYTDEHGRPYFYNAETGESKWERPAGTRKLKTLVKSGMFKGAADKRRCLPFVRDMVRNCSNKIFLKQFLLGPENYAQYINTNDVDGDGLSPFHIACTYTTRLDVLATLIDECGADIMHTTEDDRTALDVSLGAGRVDISKFLMCRGGLTTLQKQVTVVAKKERQDFYQDWRARGLKSLLSGLGDMFRSDWADFDAVIVERGGGYIDVLFRKLPVGHEDEFTVAAYMDDVATEHDLVKKWKLQVMRAQWNRRTVAAGKALQFRFKPPWYGLAKT